VHQVIQKRTLGISLMALKTYRSQDRQMDLFDQCNRSCHGDNHYGLARFGFEMFAGARTGKALFVSESVPWRHILIWRRLGGRLAAA